MIDGCLMQRQLRETAPSIPDLFMARVLKPRSGVGNMGRACLAPETGRSDRMMKKKSMHQY